MRVIVLHPDGLVVIGDLELKEATTLKTFAKEIGCDICERFYSFKENMKDYCFWCDEEGLFKDTPKLNLMASYYHGMKEHGQPIVGKVIIARDKVTKDDIKIAGLTDKDCSFIMNDMMESFPEVMKMLSKIAEQRMSKMNKEDLN